MDIAVVGHCEWVSFVRVPHMPRAGDIVHAAEAWDEPGGGGPGAAVQLARLASRARLLTALGDDDLGRRMRVTIGALGVSVSAATVAEPTRRAITHVDADGERTITVIGDRLEPQGAHPLPWDALAACDAVYFVSGDVEALRSARRARVLVATSRVMPVLHEGGVALDALVGSATDPGEAYVGDLDPAPALVVRTEGARGGWFAEAGQPPRRFAASAPPPRIVDRYGAGDAFAAGLTFALARGAAAADAVAFAARCGAATIGGRGPYEGQLRLT